MGMIIGLAIALVVFVGLTFIPSEIALLNYNLMDIITATIITYLVYYFSKKDNDTNRRNEKIEETIGLIRQRLYEVFSSPIEVADKAKYLHSFKYIDNKIFVLEKLSSHLDCKEDIEKIKNEKQKMDEFINENISCGNEYFTGESVKDKIPNILCNIENHLDNIIIKIYDIK